MEKHLGPLFLGKPEVIDLLAPLAPEEAAKCRRTYRKVLVTITRWMRGEVREYETY